MTVSELSTALGKLSLLIQAALYRFHIGKDQFHIDGFNVTQSVHAAIHVNDVIVREATHNVQNRIHLADMSSCTLRICDSCDFVFFC